MQRSWRYRISWRHNCTDRLPHRDAPSIHRQGEAELRRHFPELDAQAAAWAALAGLSPAEQATRLVGLLDTFNGPIPHDEVVTALPRRGRCCGQEPGRNTSRPGSCEAPPADAAFVRRLLGFLADRGWAGAPRYLGVDGRGRVVLSFVDGDVPWGAGAPPIGDAALAAVARLVREFHELTAGSGLAAGQEVVCHHDLSPGNTVFRGGSPVAFIDWDLAGPGSRVQDVAHVCWQFAPLGPGVAVGEAVRRVRVVTDAYGWTDLSGLVETVLWWQDRCWRGIESAADAGVPAMVRLRDAGAVEAVRAAYGWTARHAARLGGGAVQPGGSGLMRPSGRGFGVG